MDLDCTSPLRDVEDISKAIAQFRASDVDAVFTVCDARKNPYFNMLRDNWGKKLREMFDSLEDPVWNGDATDIPLKKIGKHSPLKKIATPEEKLI